MSDVGSAVSLYFKMLKYMALVFLVFSVLSLPTYYFYLSGNQENILLSDIKTVLSYLSLGNIG